MSVARMGYDAWQANKRVEITGLRNRLDASLVRFMPRTMRAAHRAQSAVAAVVMIVIRSLLVAAALPLLRRRFFPPG